MKKQLKFAITILPLLAAAHCSGEESTDCGYLGLQASADASCTRQLINRYEEERARANEVSKPKPTTPMPPPALPPTASINLPFVSVTNESCAITDPEPKTVHQWNLTQDGKLTMIANQDWLKGQCSNIPIWECKASVVVPSLTEEPYATFLKDNSGRQLFVSMDVTQNLQGYSFPEVNGKRNAGVYYKFEERLRTHWSAQTHQQNDRVYLPENNKYLTKTERQSEQLGAVTAPLKLSLHYAGSCHYGWNDLEALNANMFGSSISIANPRLIAQ